MFIDAGIQTCLTQTAPFGLLELLWQKISMVASLLERAGLDWHMPDFITLCRRQKGLIVQIPYHPSSGALHIMIDSKGVKAKCAGEWLVKKHGSSKPPDWRKIHLGIDAETLEIRAFAISGSRIGNAAMLPEQLDQISDDQPLSFVTADSAYGTRTRHAAIAAREATAIISPRKNGKPWKEPTEGAALCNEALRIFRRLDRAIWKRWAGYHRRYLT